MISMFYRWGCPNVSDEICNRTLRVDFGLFYEHPFIKRIRKHDMNNNKETINVKYILIYLWLGLSGGKGLKPKSIQNHIHG